MSVISDAAQPRGDIMRRLAELERQVQALATARRLEAASIGSGGLRILGGLLRIQDVFGTDMFRAGGDPGEVFIREDILGPLARDVVAETLFTGEEFGIGQRNDQDYGDLAGIDSGPTVSELEIGTAGKAVVGLSCSIGVDIGAGLAGFMSVEVSGATEIPPNDGFALRFGLGGDPALDVTLTADASKLVVITGLAPGSHTFTAKYRTLTEGGLVNFINPRMIVWAF